MSIVPEKNAVPLHHPLQLESFLKAACPLYRGEQWMQPRYLLADETLMPIKPGNIHPFLSKPVS